MAITFERAGGPWPGLQRCVDVEMRREMSFGTSRDLGLRLQSVGDPDDRYTFYKNKLLLLQSVCHNRWPRPLTRVFVAVIERTFPEGWHA
jgi:hypothetical protein